MNNSIKPSNCERCIHFARLTAIESAIIQPKLDQAGLAKEGCIGVCFHKIKRPHLLIRRYIFGNKENCELFVQGYNRDLLGIKCPICKQGELALSRPVIQGKTTILIGCNRYPDCRFSARQVPLQTLCRFCKTPIMLSAGEILKCLCPKCQRAIQIPLTLRLWPNLVNPNGGCVHPEPVQNCALCQDSRKQQINLLDLELPLLAKWIKAAWDDGRDPYQLTSPAHDRMMEDYWKNWDEHQAPEEPDFLSEEVSKKIHRYYYGGPPEEAPEPSDDDDDDFTSITDMSEQIEDNID